MLLAKLITPKKTNALGRLSAIRRIVRFSFSITLIASYFPAFSQDNSPYTRYGLGDLVPSTNINTRAMGSISTGYNDFFSINFSNPASYGSFYAISEERSKKLRWARAILDVGVSLDNRVLVEPHNPGKFSASNALFSHLQIGIPLRTNWGLSFGIRPITRISYKTVQRGIVLDAITNLPTTDSTVTLNAGDGGTYLASVGTGFKIKNFSFGINGGYMFGKKDYSSRKSIINDTVAYNSGNYQTQTTYGNLYFNLGMQYQVRLDSITYMTLGAFGNLKQKLNASQDLIRETFYQDPSSGNIRIDSVYGKDNIKGEIIYPASFTAGVMIQRLPVNKKGGWLIGVDFNQGNWKEYRMYGQVDSVRNKWEVRVGGELRPSLDAARKSYFGNVAYRAGFFIGPDYIQVKNKLPVFGASVGLGLPLRNFNRLNNQVSLINLSFEYIKRGNNDNLLKENIFRLSMGLSFSDLWFIRKKYE